MCTQEQKKINIKSMPYLTLTEKFKATTKPDN